MTITTFLQNNPFFLNLISATLMIIGGFVIGRLSGLALRRILKSFNLNKNISLTTGYQVILERQLGNILSSIIYAISIILALRKLHILNYAILLFAIIFGGIIFISTLLGFKDALLNIYARITRPLKPGSSFKKKYVQGVVIKQGLFATIVKDKEGDLLYIPNFALLQQETKSKREHHKKRSANNKKHSR